MNKSGETKNLAAALKKAQSQMGEVKFDSNNPFYKSRYASLGAVITASKQSLTDNGLVVSQLTTTNEFGVGITTILMHDSGEYIESTITLPISDVKNIAQEAGKIITYLRRYSLASLLNLYSDEDTDAEQKKSEPKKAVQHESAVMTLEIAMQEKGSSGELYGDCTTEELNGKLIGITKALNGKDLDDDKKDKYIWKMEAIKLILANRK
jgi:hypothetical protein